MINLKEKSLSYIMKEAYKNHIVIPAFNVPYLPMIEPIIDTVKRLNSFCLIEVARPDIEKFSAKSFKDVFIEFNNKADRNFIRLHQDHIPVIDEDLKEVDWKSLISEAIDLGYDSVMIDGSRLSLNENIKVTKEVVEIAHKKNVPVEAELGAVMGHEAGPLPPYEEIFSSGKGFTDVDEAKRFVKETKVDWLSVAVGNIHGAISGVAKDQKKIEAKLNIEHLKKLSDALNIPLVLHGGSGINHDYVLAGIKNGITKINVGTNLRQAYEKGLKESIDVAQKSVADEVEYLIKDYYGIEDSVYKLNQS